MERVAKLRINVCYRGKKILVKLILRGGVILYSMSHAEWNLQQKCSAQN